MILLIDNYDSFVFNLARYFERLGHPTRVIRNDVIEVADVLRLNPGAIVLSPGPGKPSEAGVSLELVRRLYRRYPILGVCLGHQAIAAALGARIVRAGQPMHGRPSKVHHRAADSGTEASNGHPSPGLFAGLPTPLVAGRYHSLVVDEATLPTELHVTARTADGLVMAVEHCRLPLAGVQFHPESILTEHGYELLANFLNMAGLPTPANPPAVSTELALPAPAQAWEQQPRGSSTMTAGR